MCVPTRTHIIYIALPYNCVIQPWGAKLLAKKRQASEATFFPEPPSSTTSSPVSQVDRRLLIHIHAYTCFRAPPPIVGEHWPRREREREKKKKRGQGMLECLCACHWTGKARCGARCCPPLLSTVRCRAIDFGAASKTQEMGFETRFSCPESIIKSR